MEVFQDLPGLPGGEVHQDIAAENEVHGVGLGRQGRINILRQVKVGKAYHLLQVRQNFKLAVPLGEIPLDELGRGGPKRPFAVEAPAGLLQGQGADVRGQDMNLPVLQIGDQPAKQDGEGIGLFAGGATGAPDPEPPLSLLPAVADQFRQQVVFQDRQALFLPKKIGLPHREVAGQDA